MAELPDRRHPTSGLTENPIPMRLRREQLMGSRISLEYGEHPLKSIWRTSPPMVWRF